MARQIDCPITNYPGAYIVLPDQWLGYHAQRRDQAVEAAQNYKSGTMTQFAVSMALLEEWNIPGLAGNPEKWDFTKLDLSIIAWVNEVVLSDFAKALTVPKGSSSPSLSG